MQCELVLYTIYVTLFWLYVNKGIVYTTSLKSVIGQNSKYTPYGSTFKKNPCSIKGKRDW
jgi:hypothetical protein